MPKATDSLNMKSGKYVLAFSELKSLKDANTGAFYVIDESGKFLSQSTKQDLAEPISMTSTNNQAYVVNNRSAQRSSIDLKTGKIESINFNENLSHSFSIQSNNDYVIYDIAGELKDGQKLVYWHRNKPSNKKSLTIPHGFTHSIHIERDDAYITTADPDAIAYIHHVDLKNGDVVSSKKLDLDDEEYSKSGLPGNPALTYYKGYLYYAVNQVKAESDDNVRGEILEFDITHEGRMKLAKAWFCKSPLCPMCNWRKTMKRSIQTTKIVEEVIRQKPKARWLFLTLTVKNVFDGKALDKSLKVMAQGFNRLMKYKKVAQNMIGFMRSTEVTVNKKDGSYNQHMHVLLCVESKYFKGAENYLSQEDWTSLWQKAMKLDYVPVVHIEAVKNKKRNQKKEVTAIQAAVQETAKYSVKDSDYLTGNLVNDLEVVKDLEEGLYRKRMIAYDGLLKKVHKQLNLDDVEDGDLIRVDDEKLNEEEIAYSIVAQWNWILKNYFI